jgi:hypothetical protein
MGAHPIYCALRYGGIWNDVTVDVHQPAALRATRGAQDETGGLKSSTLALTFVDITTSYPRYDPDHPLSPLYGIAGRNTRMLLGSLVAVEGFESATPVVARTDAGTAFWTRSTTDAHTGTWSLRAGTVGNSQVSDVTLATPATANAIQFWYKVSSQDPGDGLQVLVDGVSQYVNLAGITGWLQLTVPCLPGGTVRFRYTKDAAGSAGADTAWIDDVTYYQSRAFVETSSWEPDQSLNYALGKGFRSTDVGGSGLLQRVGRWKQSLRSPVYLQISSRVTAGRLLGYWPCEDPAGSTGLTNTVPGGPPGLATNVQYASGADFSGSDPVLKLTATGKVSGRFLKPTGTPNGWQLSWAFQLGATPAALTPVLTWTTSNGYRWYFLVDAVGWTVQAWSPDGLTTLMSTGSVWNFDPVTRATAFRMKVSAAAGTVTVEPAWYMQDAPTVYGLTTTFAGTAGNLLGWGESGNAVTDGMTFGHVYAVSGITDDLQDYNTLQAFNGYKLERAADRFSRLMAYYGLGAQLVGNAVDTQPMGPQKSGRLYELLKEIQATEDGPMYDSESRSAIVFRTRASMYNQAAALTLTRAQLAPPFKKKTDDLVTGNRVTARNAAGGEYTFEVTTGLGSTQDPPNGAGLYEQTADVSVADVADLDEIAGWFAYKWSDTSARYPQVTIDCNAQPSLEGPAGLVGIGDRIVLSDVAPGGVGLIVLGIQETWTTKFVRMITFVCGPDTMYQVGAYDAATSLWDSATTTLAVARDAVQTAWSITSTDPSDAWSTVTPYGWIVEGETMTVTAMSAPAGTGPVTQTATVTRGTNGVPKPHPAGAVINVSPTSRWAR